MKSDGSKAKSSDISNVEQNLALCKGQITSRFVFERKNVTDNTAVHPALDLLSVSIESNLFAENKLAVRFAFPYGSQTMQAADWTQPEKYQTKITAQTANAAKIERTLDEDIYFATV